VPDHLRGYLSRFLVECGTGLYVGNVSPRVVEALWTRSVEAAAGGEVVLVTSDPASEQGYSVRIHQSPGRVTADFDGLQLVQSRYSENETETAVPQL
jgi:CRISPR-associated protein Cas2